VPGAISAILSGTRSMICAAQVSAPAQSDQIDLGASNVWSRSVRPRQGSGPSVRLRLPPPRQRWRGEGRAVPADLVRPGGIVSGTIDRWGGPDWPTAVPGPLTADKRLTVVGASLMAFQSFLAPLDA
jgi:hypothetical protein